MDDAEGIKSLEQRLASLETTQEAIFKEPIIDVEELIARVVGKSAYPSDVYIVYAARRVAELTNSKPSIAEEDGIDYSRFPVFDFRIGIPTCPPSAPQPKGSQLEPGVGAESSK